jgi:hypothetical protein
VDPGTQSGITSNLTAIVEPIPPPQLSLQGDPAQGSYPKGQFNAEALFEFAANFALFAIQSHSLLSPVSDL